MNPFEEMIKIARQNRKYSTYVRELDIDTHIHELISEVNEVEEAIKNKDMENLKEELGDVLWDTVTMLVICEEKYGFGIDDSINNVIEKMKGRKPHIFEKKILTLEEEKVIWDAAKVKEKMIRNDN